MNLVEMLHSAEWPEAVPAHLICKNEDHKRERAEGILDFVMDRAELEGKKLLDYGCGEGHVVDAASGICSEAVGFDPDRTGQEGKNGRFASSFEEVAAETYDVILLYDVVDHLDDPRSHFQRLAPLLKTDGTVIARCHPWCSRHGEHYYTSINKAFIHLCFSAEELDELGATSLQPQKQKIIHPIKSYRSFFRDIFRHKSEEFTRNRVESFFSQNSELRERIRWHYRNSPDEKARDWPNFQMEQSFVDYVLQK